MLHTTYSDNGSVAAAGPSDAAPSEADILAAFKKSVAAVATRRASGSGANTLPALDVPDGGHVEPVETMPALTFDLGQAAEFIRLLEPRLAGASGWDTMVTFQTADDDKKRKNHKLTRVINATLLDAITAPDPQDGDEWKIRNLLTLNGLRTAIWVTINETNLYGRKAANIRRVRAIWQEDDNGFAGTYPLKPSIVVETSPGHFHRLWLLEGADDLSFTEHRGVMERMVADYGSDKGAKDLERVLRVPGFYHQKREPFLVRIVEASGERYSREEILRAFPRL